MQKLTFPLVHPSMLRRIGFRWLETCKGLETPGFRVGYGSPIANIDAIKAAYTVNKNAKIIIASTFSRTSPERLPVKIMEAINE